MGFWGIVGDIIGAVFSAYPSSSEGSSRGSETRNYSKDEMKWECCHCGLRITTARWAVPNRKEPYLCSKNQYGEHFWDTVRR